MLAPFWLTAGLLLVVIVPPPLLGTGVPPTILGAAGLLRDAAEFPGEILVEILVTCKEVVGEAALAGEPPVVLVVMVPPPVLGAGVPMALLDTAAPLRGAATAVFAGETLVVMMPGPLTVGDGTWA